MRIRILNVVRCLVLAACAPALAEQADAPQLRLDIDSKPLNTALTSPSHGDPARSDISAANFSGSGTMRVARLCPGCHGNSTVGTAQTGKPSVSSANTAARLPTEPRTTWLEMTITARGAWVSGAFIRSIRARKARSKTRQMRQAAAPGQACGRSWSRRARSNRRLRMRRVRGPFRRARGRCGRALPDASPKRARRSPRSHLSFPTARFMLKVAPSPPR